MSCGAYRVVNIGGGAPVGLLAFVDEVERAPGVPLKRNLMDNQPGDVAATWAAADLWRRLRATALRPPISVDVPAFAGTTGLEPPVSCKSACVAKLTLHPVWFGQPQVKSKNPLRSGIS